MKLTKKEQLERAFERILKNNSIYENLPVIGNIVLELIREVTIRTNLK